jgi:hypothetical protein
VNSQLRLVSDRPSSVRADRAGSDSLMRERAKAVVVDREADADETPAVGHGERTQQEGIDDAEDGRVRGQGERERRRRLRRSLSAAAGEARSGRQP